jgi:hypothetical protein
MFLVGALSACSISPDPQDTIRQAWEERDAERARERHRGGLALWLVAALAVAAHDPFTSTRKARWLVTCSCGWERECSSEWAVQSVSRLHPQLSAIDVTHVTRVEGPDQATSGGQQLT